MSSQFYAILAVVSILALLCLYCMYTHEVSARIIEECNSVIDEIDEIVSQVALVAKKCSEAPPNMIRDAALQKILQEARHAAISLRLVVQNSRRLYPDVRYMRSELERVQKSVRFMRFLLPDSTAV